MADAEQPDYTTLTVQLLTAYVSNNTVPIDQLPGLIEQTRATLAKRDESAAMEDAPEQTFVQAVSVRKSLSSPDHIVSMIDGRNYRSLKRHLSANGLTPAEYRARYKLPAPASREPAAEASETAPAPKTRRRKALAPDAG